MYVEEKTLNLGKFLLVARGELSVFVCVWASKRLYLLTHMLRSMETSWRKAGMWQTRSSSSSFSLYFTLLLYLFAQGRKKRTIKQRYWTKQLCGREQKPMWDYNGLPQSALKSQAQKSRQENNSNLLLFQNKTSVSLDVSVKWQKLRFCLHLTPHLICCFCCFFFPLSPFFPHPLLNSSSSFSSSSSSSSLFSLLRFGLSRAETQKVLEWTYGHYI